PDGKPYNRTKFLWDGMRLAQESRPEGTGSLYIYSDPGSYEPLARVDKAGKEGPNRILYFHTDVNGAPEEMTDSDGKIVWETGYQVWGNTIQEKDHGGVEQNLRYQGQYLDRETGLHYNLHRYYDPDVGRFMVTDPIGLRGGLNLYQYGPNPLSWIDPLGLSGSGLVNGVPQNPGIVRRFMSKAEYKDFLKNGFVFDPTDPRGGISVTSVKVDPKNPDAIKRSTGALGADYYVDIDTTKKNVELKGKTKGGVMDWKIKDNVDPKDIVNRGKVRKC
ncbi:RHS repeat-associated core domain-containing protein, partial [Escherichia coli]